VNDAPRVVINAGDQVDRPLVAYKWRFDTAYFTTTIDRYYKQRPLLLRLPVQFTLAWLVCVLAYWSTGVALKDFAGWAIVAGVVVIPAGILLTRQGILLRYRLRQSFGTDVHFSMRESCVSISGTSQDGRYPWTAYTGAVRFVDGILLLRRGAIRWLPDGALQEGTAEDATRLVSSHVKMRAIGWR
jgi:hypothetical protein